jgi:UDP-perosamine 4-acetyltransferase
MEKIILVGAGGHCKVIIDIIKSNGKFEIVGITDKEVSPGNNILGVPIIGDDSVLPDVYKSGVRNAFVCIGALNNLKVRDKIQKNLNNIGFETPILIHPKAIVSPFAKIKSGTCVMAGAVINPGTTIAENCIINSGAVIEHDCNIGRNVHISPRACICGGVSIKEHSHIGAGSTIIQSINIGREVKIGAGAVVISDIGENVTAVGIPAKVIKYN